MSNRTEFQSLVANLTTTLANIDIVYPKMIADAQPFDRELARKLEEAMKADRALLEYVRSKAEAQQALPSTVVIGLLGR